MKLLALLVFFSPIISPCRAEDAPPLKLKCGFRDLSFGAKSSDVVGLMPDGRFEDYIIYKRPEDILKLGNTRLDSIHYDFWDGRLAMVSLNKKTTLLSNSSQDLEEFLISIYGKPTEIKKPDPNSFIKISQETWEDDKTCVIYTTMVSSASELGEINTSIVIESKEIDAERMKIKGETNSNGPNGL